MLTPVLGDAPAIVEITDPRYRRDVVSRTFEGRDRFAPAAAWLLRGVPLEALGARVTDPATLDLPRPVAADGVLRGVLVAADRFGNVATSIDRHSLEAFAGGGPVRLTLGGRPLRLVATYTEIADGEVAALFGSAGLLEIAARSAPALGRPGVHPGAPVTIVDLGLGRE